MSISARLSKTMPPALAALLVVAVLWMPASASAGRHDAGWTEYCPWVMTTHDDPIFYPGQPGAAAAHDFFGNLHTNASSTYDSLRKAGSETSCLANPYDDSAYWTPELLKGGKPVQAKTMFQYYWAPPGNTPEEAEAIPPGLKMYGNHFFWTCGGGGSLGPDGLSASPDGGVKAPRKKAPFDCSAWPGSRVTAVVFLPNCWDGSHVDSSDHMSHMAYPDPHAGCPAGHSHVLPGLYVGINWYLTDGTGATLSTGPISTMRAMFFDAWDPAEMTRLMAACMTNGKWCGAWTHSGQDRAPVVKAAQIIPADVHDTDVPTALAVNPHDPDGDQYTLHYLWQDNGQTVGTDSVTLANDQFAPGDMLTVTITAIDDHGNWSIPVVSKLTTVNYDVVAPKPAKPGGVLVNVHGGGFGNTESVSLHLDSQGGTVLATVTTDVLGMFPDTDITLPKNISGGTHWLYGVGATSHIVGKGPFTVGSYGDLAPSSLAVGDPATFTGVGYVPNEIVSLSFPNQAPQQFVADSQGMVVAPLVAPAEAGPGQALSVSSSGDAYDLPYKVIPTMTLPASGEPGVAMPFSLTGFGPTEQVEMFVDDVDSGQHFAADATGAASGQVTLATTFGPHQVRFTGLTSGVDASTHVSLPAYLTLNPTSGPAGTSVEVSSPFGWPHGESVAFSWDKVNAGNATADGTGSIDATFVVPTHKIGKVVARLTDTQLGVSPSADFTVTGSKPENSAPSIGAVLIDGTPFTNSTFTGVAHNVKDPDGDPVTLHYTWFVDGKKVGGDTSTFSSSSLKSGDILDLWMRPQDNHGNWGDNVEANSKITMKWEIDAPPARPTESSHPVDLSNYAPSEDVALHLDSPNGQLIDTITMNQNGNAFNQQVPMPWPLPGGAHVLYGVGKSSGIVGRGPLSIDPIAFAVPGLLHVGDSTVISASGFKPGESVTASFPHTRGVSEIADNTGTVSIEMTMPEEPFPGGDITVIASSGTTTTPFKTWSSMTFATNVAEPQDSVPFSLHGYGPSETVQASIVGTDVTQMYTTNPDGSLDATMLMDAPFGKIHIVVLGLSSGQQHNWKINLAPYVKVTPNPAHPGDTLTITSLYGWGRLHDSVYVYWGKNVVQVLTPDAQGSIQTTFVVPSTQKSGIVSLKLLDTQLGKYAVCKVTIIS